MMDCVGFIGGMNLAERYVKGLGKGKLERYTRQTGRKGGVRIADSFSY